MELSITKAKYRTLRAVMQVLIHNSAYHSRIRGHPLSNLKVERKATPLKSLTKSGPVSKVS